MSKKEIMKTINCIILELLTCDDEKYVDAIISTVSNGEMFTIDEMNCFEQ